MHDAPPVQIIGEVMRPTEVRTAIDARTQRTVPILYIWLRVQGQDRPVLVQQPFPFDCRPGAEAAARRYSVGSRLKVDADMSSIQLTFSHVAHIHLLETRPSQSQAQA